MRSECKGCEGWDKDCMICCECWDRQWPSTPDGSEGCKFQCKHGSYCNIAVARDYYYESCTYCEKTLCETHLLSLDSKGHCIDCRMIEDESEEDKEEERQCSYSNCENKDIYSTCNKCQSYYTCKDHQKALCNDLCDECRCPLPWNFF